MYRVTLFALLFVPLFVSAATIVAPTQYVDGRDLPLSDLSHYDVECDGVSVEYSVTGAQQTLDIYGSCRATVTSVNGDESAWSATVVILNPTPAAPVLLVD